MTDTTPIILAYSGGLDTSFCVPWLKETYNRPVVTMCINTGGLDDTAAANLEERALTLGAEEHVLVEARQQFFDRVLRYLIAGNIRRGNLYPLCVGAERGIQATLLAELASERGSTTVAHGCTAAGNDQVRFEVALRTVNPGLEVLAPVRDQSFVREQQVKYLTDNNYPMPPSGGDYSINRGLWGVSIGGKETLDSHDTIPESEWVLSAGAFDKLKAPEQLSIGFDKGIPVALNGQTLDPVALIEKLETIGGGFGIGRGIHVGDTVLGTKGRVAFEAPAAEMLLDAHRELEKLTLSALQSRVKESLANTYGDFVHEGKQLDPACRDIEALLESSQEHVSGDVKLILRPGNAFVAGVESPYSLMAASKGVYGEAAGEWTPQDALGFSRILALPGMLQSRAAKAGKEQK
ncbi:MAG: argininosuccinate synthase [Gammaproteobacteria bacterium]|jgi:argininosuccinate synthase|nr:argininosuccinate synthase [Gammaproteobacteria bacterium]MDP6617620.1 argininosuccinate synthase [Gammaproteobacteria bacterium]MDP6694497.1 argininosuccinate synthase [Gammaproteobacteria bacterium]MDP7041557.1 argininosuccinate synthase [Gammaproteobacteria bacterium]